MCSEWGKREVYGYVCSECLDWGMLAKVGKLYVTMNTDTQSSIVSSLFFFFFISTIDNFEIFHWALTAKTVFVPTLLLKKSTFLS